MFLFFHRESSPRRFTTILSSLMSWGSISNLLIIAQKISRPPCIAPQQGYLLYPTASTWVQDTSMRRCQTRALFFLMSAVIFSPPLQYLRRYSHRSRAWGAVGIYHFPMSF